MPQSSKIFGFLAVAWIVFITMRGELPIYLGFLFGSTIAPGSGLAGGSLGGLLGSK